MDVPKEWVAEAKKIEKEQEKTVWANKTSFVKGSQIQIMPTPGFQHGGYYNGYYDEIAGVSDELPKKQDDRNIAIALPSEITSAGTKV
jgi:hypothetical protein